MSFTEDKENKEQCETSYKLVTERGSELELTIQCLTQQVENTEGMQAVPEKRIAKRERNAKAEFTKGQKKALEAELKSIQFFTDHLVKLRNKLTELEAELRNRK